MSMPNQSASAPRIRPCIAAPASSPVFLYIFVSDVLDACSVTVYSEAAGYFKLGCLEVNPRGVPRPGLGPKARKRAGHRVGCVVVSTHPRDRKISTFVRAMVPPY